MEIKFKTQPAPSIPRSVQEELDRNHPTVWLRWNRDTELWEIWIELVPNTHDLNRFVVSKKDRFHNGSIYRKLQSWTYDDGSFCPIDRRILRSFKLADTFLRHDFYQEVIVAEDERQAAETTKQAKELGYAGRHRYYDVDNPRISMYNSRVFTVDAK